MLENLVRQYLEKNLPGTEENFEFDAIYGTVLDIDDGTFKIHIEPRENKAWFYCSLIKIPVRKREKFYQSLLVNQIFGELTKGAHFSLNMEKQEVLLCLTVDISDKNFEKFDIQLTQFLESCWLWKTTFEQWK